MKAKVISCDICKNRIIGNEIIKAREESDTNGK